MAINEESIKISILEAFINLIRFENLFFALDNSSLTFFFWRDSFNITIDFAYAIHWHKLFFFSLKFFGIHFLLKVLKGKAGEIPARSRHSKRKAKG